MPKAKEWTSTPAHDDKGEFSFFTLRASEEVRSRPARRKLFRILRKVGQNLEAELCPRDPKSIRTKAQDVIRNLPHWQRYVDQLPVSDDAVELSRETDICEEVLKAAKAIVDQLQPLVGQGIHDDPRAQEEWSNFKSTVRAALGHMNREFKSSGTRQPDTPSEVSVANGTNHTRPSNVQ